MQQSGQPLNIKEFIPTGMTADDFYVMLAGIAAFLCVMAIGMSFNRNNGMNSRLKSLQERRTQLRTEMGAPRRRKKPESSVNMMRSVVNRLQLLKNSQIGKTIDQLNQAGWRSKDAIVIYAFFNLITPLIFAGIGLAMMNLHFSPKYEKWKILLPIVMVYIGLKLPGMIVARQRRKRYYAIQKALSDSLDLMMICAEAGLSLAAALDRVSRELSIAYPVWAEELSLTSIEMGFLPERNKALLNLADRVKMQEVRGIVSVLVQTEKYGTPIAQALRVLAAEFREQRMLRAEQKAARLPAIMTVPMILFILPTLFIVVIAPAAIKLSDTMK